MCFTHVKYLGTLKICVFNSKPLKFPNFISLYPAFGFVKSKKPQPQSVHWKAVPKATFKKIIPTQVILYGRTILQQLNKQLLKLPTKRETVLIETLTFLGVDILILFYVYSWIFLETLIFIFLTCALKIRSNSLKLKYRNKILFNNFVLKQNHKKNKLKYKSREKYFLSYYPNSNIPIDEISRYSKIFNGKKYFLY